MSNFNIKISNKLSELDRLIQSIEEYFETINISTKQQFNIQICIDEIVTNIINYGYPNMDNGNIELSIELEAGLIKLIIKDDALPYNPLDAPEPDLESPLESRRIGGLGVFLVKQLSKNQIYERKENINYFTVVFKMNAEE
jgi:anti-sigma regulatory factor (Ser/Thr protein kinase)